MQEIESVSVDERVSEIAARHHGVFTRRAAVEAGATEGVIRHRLGTKRWVKAHAGVYRLAGAPTTWRRAVCAATLAAGDGAAAATLAAAALQRIPGFREGRLTVTALRHRSRVVDGVQVNETLLLP